MWSAKNESRIRPLNATMNNTCIENHSPTFLVPQVPTFQVKRLTDLDNDLRMMSNKKQRQNSYRNMSSTTNKYSSRKSLSQNMSTSKKLTAQKRTDHSIVKRSIDFNNALKSELQQYTKNNKVQKTPIKPLTNDSFRNSTNNLPRYSTDRFTITQNTPLTTDAKRKTLINSILKKSPKSTKKITSSVSLDFSSPKQDNVSVVYNSPDKENVTIAHPFFGLSSPTMELQNVLNSETILKNSSNTSEIKDLLDKNSNTIKNMIDIMSTLLENNNKLAKLIGENQSISENDINSTIKERHASKTDINSTTRMPSASTSKPNFRKYALFNGHDKNTQPKVKIESPKIKRSMKIYKEMKSNMKFLKTPSKDGTQKVFINETPNTKSMSTLSENVQQQLRLLYDSPDN
ncbi:uncharacterized protein LOC143921742 [Arctopsyche grandis]|uniref:uncharacterized protein LOC143921742 n=1 Tax=Arctopsyche grandis TaxID=121162 RepID=UPI00406D8737